jgi:NAD(P)-dependent dehydrogenase (short-subunit alcohol dehydrogenase family)
MSQRIALIQGASRGIGLALVAQLLSDGDFDHVYATSRSATSADALRELAVSFPGRLTLLSVDVTNEASIADAAATVQHTHAEMHLLMNVAGILHDDSVGMHPEKRLSDIQPEFIARAFAVNATGPLLMIKHFSPLLRHRERSVVANVSARVGSIGDNALGGWYGYRASKAAQNMFTRTAAIELKRRGPGNICVAIHPGTVETDLSAPFSGNVAPEKLFSPELAAQQLLTVLGGLTPEHTGGFFAWDGAPIPW